jgi:hypothetical protein
MTSVSVIDSLWGRQDLRSWSDTRLACYVADRSPSSTSMYESVCIVPRTSHNHTLRGRACLTLRRFPFRLAGAAEACSLLCTVAPGRPARGSAPVGATFSCRGWPEATLAWQCPDPVSNVEASAAMMRGYPGPMRKWLGVLIRDEYLKPDPPFGTTEESSALSSRGAQIRSLCAAASTESAGA